MFDGNVNARTRDVWIQQALANLPPGARILDVGAGEQPYRAFCSHLVYVSQDFCHYDGAGNGEGLQPGAWNTKETDLVSDITDIPAPAGSFDAILCSEVLEHVPEPTKAFDEFARLLKPGGPLLLTAPFAPIVHMAPYHYCTGFSRYWYEYHLALRGFTIKESRRTATGSRPAKQELKRLGSMARRYGNWSWPIAYAMALPSVLSENFAITGELMTWHVSDGTAVQSRDR